nr:retrovirus-related Pol polyprotein from transposon TNT 1-94 [Tanacetum cinerariifolium]
MVYRRVVIEEEHQEKNNNDQPEQPEQSEPQVESVEEEADNTSTGVEDSITVRKGKRNAPRPARYAGCVNTYNIDYVAYALAVGDDIGSDDPKTYKEAALLKSEFEMKDLGAAKKILDSDYGGDLVKRRSLTCFIFTLFRCVGLKVEKPALLCDSRSALSLAKNLVYHERTKHIDVRLNFIRDVLEKYRKETTKRDTEEPLAVGEIPSQGGDCCLSDLDLAIYYPKYNGG